MFTTLNMLCLMSYVSHVMCHMSPFDTFWWRVCYQQRLTRLVSRSGQSQGLLYIYYLIHSFSHLKISLWHRHTQTVKDCASSHKIGHEGHLNCCIGSKVTGIWVKGGILPSGGVALGRVCACSLRSRLIY